MAAATLLTLLDDIASLLDDVAGMTKTAAGKTAGVVGDDLALNAKQVMGTPAERELPVVWVVAKGSFVNKVFLVPAAILLSAFLPMLVMPLLMLGGLFLCFEGAEKILHKHAPDAVGVTLSEKDKIKGAIRTDFILSAEIIIIALGIVADSPLPTRILTLCAIGAGMTVFVYGLVGAIVKLDDLGLYLATKSNIVLNKIGQGILVTAPWLMRALGFFGTAAMFMVGGQIVLHGVPDLHHAADHLAQFVPVLTAAATILISGFFGLFAGMVVVALKTAGSRLWRSVF